MVHKIFFCSKLADISDMAGRKTARRRTHANANCYAFHAKTIIYWCVLFGWTENIDETATATLEPMH